MLAVYGLYLLRDLDNDKLATVTDDDLRCAAPRVVKHFKDTLRGQGLALHGARKYRSEKRESMKPGLRLRTLLI